MSTHVTTGLARLSYVNLTTPRSKFEGQAPKYSVTILVPKSDKATKAAIDKAVNTAITEGISKKWDGKRPAIIPTPVYDGDSVRPSDGEAFGEECQGMWVFTASANADRKPPVVDANVQEIIDPNRIYSGMWGKVNVNFFPYSFAGKKGIGCGLNAIQKIKDDEPLGGGAVDVNRVFSPVYVDPITGALVEDNQVPF